jgi:hypothetical protein
MTVASITPWTALPGTPGTGMPTGVAPSDENSMLVTRVGARSFTPFRSATDSIGSGVDQAGAMHPDGEDVEVRNRRPSCFLASVQ